MLVSLNEDLVLAFQLQEVWSRCADKKDILDAVAKHNIRAGLNTLRTAIFESLAVIVIRILDEGSRNDSLFNLLSLIKEPNFQSALANEDRSEVEMNEFRIALSDADRRTEEIRKLSEYRSLRELRHQHIAHRGMRRRPTGTQYGYPRKLLEAVEPIMRKLNWSLRRVDSGFLQWRKLQRRHANRFWAKIARALSRLPG